MMAKLKVKENEIPLKAYLRADSHSQHFIVTYASGENKELVTSDMFWGNYGGEGLYLDYHKINNRQIKVSYGISEDNIVQTLNNDECDEWIDNNLLNIIEDKLIVIQGYAGSGKTTLMNHIINKIQSNDLCYIDIGRDWSYTQEPHMFFNEMLNAFDNYFERISKDNKKRNNIWKIFIELISNNASSILDLELKNIASAFKKIKEMNTRWSNLKDNIYEYLYDKYNQMSINSNSISKGQTQVIVKLIILLISAEKITNNSENKFTIIFDNLDVVTDPTIPSENVLLLWEVIHKYIKYKDECKKNSLNMLPEISIIINVRKVLYSHITSHLPELEMNIDYDNDCVNVCDISNLYLSQEILMHRINYWVSLKGLNFEIKNKLQRLGQIEKIHTKDSFVFGKSDNEDLINNKINLDALFNHNYRAFVNVLSELFEKNEYSKYVYNDLNEESKMQNWQKISTLIFCISLLYRKKQIWNTMGFGCNNFDTVDYPTTLNRLLLNCLYYSRYGQFLNDFASDQVDLPTNDFMTLKELVGKFQKNIFIKSKISCNEKQNKVNYENAENKTLNLVIERLADMCARNPSLTNSKSKGYDADDDELWRRPLFFIGGVKLNHTAISKKELYEYFINKLLNNDGDEIKFLITDEGMVLIHDIVANFEFYSARYCKESLCKPLHHVKTKKELNLLIEPVYVAIRRCIRRHKIFMNDYIRNYNINISKYLKESFHPRTNPRFSNNDDAMEFDSFRPQLHIVRVIYSHISYFNYVKNLIAESSLEEKNDICQEITNWILKYLNLYRFNYYNLFQNTSYYRDNNVYHDLIRLTSKQLNHYKTDMKNINIDIRSNK